MSLSEIVILNRTRILNPAGDIDADLIVRVPGWALIRRCDTKGLAWVPTEAVPPTAEEWQRQKAGRVTRLPLPTQH